MTDADYEDHLAELRKIYIEATPRQRYSIAKQRIDNLEHGPNVLVACVSAVEGLARSLAMHGKVLGKVIPSEIKPELSAIYPEFKRLGAESLVAEYLSGSGLPTPAEYFGPETWQRFHYAIEYRNVLVHECTYLGQDRSPELIEACQSVLHKLAKAAGLKVTDA